MKVGVGHISNDFVAQVLPAREQKFTFFSCRKIHSAHYPLKNIVPSRTFHYIKRSNLKLKTELVILKTEKKKKHNQTLNNCLKSFLVQS